MDIIACHIRHLDIMALPDHEKERWACVEDFYDRMENVIKSATACGTFVSDDRVVCMAGFTTLWPGVAEGWVMPSKYVYEQPFKYCKRIRCYLEQIQTDFNFHRVQTTAVLDEAHERWMGFLGFKREGVLHKYTPQQQDLGQYARV